MKSDLDREVLAAGVTELIEIVQKRRRSWRAFIRLLAIREIPDQAPRARRFNIVAPPASTRVARAAPPAWKLRYRALHDGGEPFSATRRGSRKPGKYEPFRSFGMRSSIALGSRRRLQGRFAPRDARAASTGASPGFAASTHVTLRRQPPRP
jgi:hypothetical protein